MRGTKNIRVLLEYQKFNPNNSLQQKIAEVNSRYFSNAVELTDDVLDVSAAGEPNSSKTEGEGNALNARGENESGNAIHSLP